MINDCTILIVKHEGKRPIGETTCKWEGNIKKIKFSNQARRHEDVWGSIDSKILNFSTAWGTLTLWPAYPRETPPIFSFSVTPFFLLPSAPHKLSQSAT